MSKTLTPDQQAFLQQFIAQAPKKAKQITNAYLDYLRRREKTEAEFNLLEPGSPARQAVDADLQLADQAADAGRFESAYKSLKAVKLSARKAAKGYVASLDPAAITRRIDALKKEVSTIKRDGADLLAAMDAATADVPTNDVLTEDTTGLSAKEKIAVVNASVVEKVRLRTDMQVQMKQGKLLEELAGGAALRLAAIQHQIDTMADSSKDKKKQAAVAVLRQAIGTVTPAAAFAEASALDPGSIVAACASRNQAFEDAIDTLDETMAGQRGRDLSGAEAKANASVEKASKRYKEAVAKDAKLGPPDPKNPLKAKTVAAPVALRTTDFDDLVDGDWNDLTDGAVSAEIAKSVTKLQTLVAGEDPKSDIIFDLMMKTPKEFASGLEEALGWDDDDAGMTPERKKACDAFGKAMAEEVLKASPNKMAADGSSVTVGGETFKKGEKLGQGGLGEVWRYEADDGRKVVVKSLLQKGDAKRKEMADEMKVHRRAMGGENGTGHPNIVNMRGAAVGGDGSLHMILDEAEGGDVDRNTRSVQAALESGAMSEEARMALMRFNFGQAARGLKFAHDANLSHNDIKGANFLVGADGTLKLADFGSGRETDDEGELLAGKREGGLRNLPGTTAFASPEHGMKGMSTKADVFVLGTMLDTMTKDTYTAELDGRIQGFRTWYSSGVNNTGHGATSLDRLRNLMLDQDPQKRPSLDSVLLSSFLDMSGDDADYNEDDLKALSKAVTAYGQKIGKQIALKQHNIGESIGAVKKARAEFEAKRTELVSAKDAIANLPGQIQTAEDALATLDEELASLKDAKPATDPAVLQAKTKQRDDAAAALAVIKKTLADAQAKDMTALDSAMKAARAAFEQKEKDEAAVQKGLRAEIKEINEGPGVRPLLDAIKAASDKVSPQAKAPPQAAAAQ